MGLNKELNHVLLQYMYGEALEKTKKKRKLCQVTGTFSNSDG